MGIGSIRGIPRRLKRAVLHCALGFAVSVSGAAAQDGKDLTALSIEDLMGIEVQGASRFAQPIIEAPAAVTIVTARDIRDFGYRSLSDVLRSVRGLHVTYDRNYSYLGARGFGRTGDFNGRFLLLVDGMRLNDPVYDSAAIGTDFPLDLEIIDRIEIVRGPGSSVYGNNAVFGIINVITRSGPSVGGVEVGAQAASFGTQAGRVAWGGRRDDGAEWLVSASHYESDGQNLRFAEFEGLARNLDHDRSSRLLGKLSLDQFSLTAGWSSRTKGIPTASYGTEFNDPRAQTEDGNAFVNLAYGGNQIGPWTLDGQLFYGHYYYNGVYPFVYDASDPVVLNIDKTRTDWYGGEGKAVGRFERHTLMMGAEYQHNPSQTQVNFDLDPHEVYTDDRRSSSRSGVYAQDEFLLKPDLRLTAGLRYDRYSTFGGTLNPRLGLIWNPRPLTALKLLYGTAFRAPNAYELYYFADNQMANPDLDPEEITSFEIILEHHLRPDISVTVSAYRNQIDDLISQLVDPVDDSLFFDNVGGAEAKGVELELLRVWDAGARLRASFAQQSAHDRQSGQWLVNSPRQLAKFNYSVPLFGDAFRTGVEVQYTGRRRTLADGIAGSYTVTNLTVTSRRLAPRLEVAASIYNLFDTAYEDPAGEEHAQDVILQDGRSFRLGLSYLFQ
jgi:outer membrane cobalamin receptor